MLGPLHLLIVLQWAGSWPMLKMTMRIMTMWLIVMIVEGAALSQMMGELKSESFSRWCSLDCCRCFFSFIVVTVNHNPAMSWTASNSSKQGQIRKLPGIEKSAKAPWLPWWMTFSFSSPAVTGSRSEKNLMSLPYRSAPAQLIRELCCVLQLYKTPCCTAQWSRCQLGCSCGKNFFHVFWADATGAYYPKLEFENHKNQYFSWLLKSEHVETNIFGDRMSKLTI